jgi:Predicted oxidoreductases (related to aryl-alcohol dehydrogenases)
VQLHSCTADVLEKGECIEALKKAREAGKTRFIGYSGDSTDAVYAIETGEFDVLQTSVNIADQECIDLVLPRAAARQMGVIAKRPIANAAWQYKSKPENEYHEDYWMRLQELKYDFINGDPKLSAETALRFTLSIKDVHTAIVGTTKPGRWAENARVLAAGLMSDAEFKQIRDHWHKIAKKEWVGQV